MNVVYIIPDDENAAQDVNAICSQSNCISIDTGTITVDADWKKSDDIYDRISCSECVNEYKPSSNSPRIQQLVDDMDQQTDLLLFSKVNGNLKVKTLQRISVVKVLTTEYSIHNKIRCSEANIVRKSSDDCRKDCSGSNTCSGTHLRLTQMGTFVHI